MSVTESEGHISCALQCLLKVSEFSDRYICKVAVFGCILQRENARHRFMASMVILYLFRGNPEHRALLEKAAKTLMELYRIEGHNDKARTAAFLEKVLASPDVRRALLSVGTSTPTVVTGRCPLID